MSVLAGSPETRDRIVKGSRAAFMRSGFNGASMSEIAAGAGVSRTALYYYFPNKQELLRAVVHRVHEETLSAAAKVLRSGTPLERLLIGLLDARIGGILRLFASSAHAYDLIEAGALLTGPKVADPDGQFQAMVIEAFERHGFADEAEAAADTLVAAAKGLMRSVDGFVSDEQFHARLRRLVAWVLA